MAAISAKNAPIGVFDSGVGGLSVLQHLRQHFPQESLIYIADSRYAPYGEKPAAFIRERSLALGRFLVEQGAKLIVVACNTATAAAVTTLREKLAVPVVGMEPAVKPAAQLTRNGKIGVLATTGTLSSARYAALLDRFGEGCEVFSRSCDGWVELVEEGALVGIGATNIVKRHLNPLLEQQVDTLILGCTHYPFLKPLIADIAGANVALVDTGAAVARRVGQLLDDKSLASSNREPATTFFSSQETTAAQAVIQRLWPSGVGRVFPLPAHVDVAGEHL